MPVYMYWSGQDFDFGNFLAVASAGLHTPDRVVLLVDEVPVDNHWFSLLAKVPRISVEPVDAESRLTPEHAALYRRMTYVAHRSDLISFWALAHGGGLYLDTDTLTTRPLDDLPHRLLLDDGKIVHIGVMGFPPGDPLPAAMVDDLLLMPPQDLDVYQSIVYRWTRLVRQTAEPGDFADLRSFFPRHWKEWEEIFTRPARAGETDSIRILHHYGWFSRHYTASMDVAWLRSHPCLFSELALPVVAALEDHLGDLDHVGALS
ncbi:MULTISPECIES: glycosyltransferase [unclassified Streptomyces]|uniref:glycosyltransferase n=1 Tax=unclassified Streptomyces TaxID=2593676 RepID=UPI00380C29EB